jgi:hypothetical protein
VQHANLDWSVSASGRDWYLYLDAGPAFDFGGNLDRARGDEMNYKTLYAMLQWRLELQDEAWIEDAVTHAQLCQGFLGRDAFAQMQDVLRRHSWRALGPVVDVRTVECIVIRDAAHLAQVLDATTYVTPGNPGYNTPDTLAPCSVCGITACQPHLTHELV